MAEKTQTIKVAAGQIVSTPGDLDGNLKQMEQMAKTAAKAGARLILFAEGAITGYLFTEGNIAKAVVAGGPETARLLAAAAKHDIVLAAGGLERSRQGLHMSHFVAFPDGKLLVQRKHCLTPTEQGACAVPGAEKRKVFSVDGVKFAICICADSGIEDIWNKMADWGVQVYLGPTAGGGGRKFMKHAADLEDPKGLKSYLRDMAKVCFMGGGLEKCVQHHMALIAVNLSGDDGVSNYHPGHASIIDAGGKTVALVPGDFVVEHLRPQLLQGEIMVRKPRRYPA
ncbi:MAG TPA: carbon-nitrogen hydrolase family protein [Armatimonadota bacterium]|jgi:predicted amidohydrolase